MITVARLRKVLDYFPKTGDFIWRVTRSAHAIEGKSAGSLDADGYRYIRIDKRLYVAHRLAFLWMTGEWPSRGFIDHIDGNPRNNKWANLRDASKGMNQQNRKGPQANNTSGYLGVSPWHGYWKAQITADYKVHCLGYFKNKKKAYAAYLTAKRRLHEGCTI